MRAAAYAEWTVWARRNFADARQAQNAAQAAFQAALQGADASAASAAGAQAASDPAFVAPPVDQRLQAYASWYAWAHLERRAPEHLAHQAAAAAESAQARGARPELAAQAASGVLYTKANTARSIGLAQDPAARALAMGIIVLSIPIVSTVVTGQSYFLIGWLPVLGIVYSIRSLRSSPRRGLAIGALAVNALGAATSILLLILKVSTGS